MQKNECKFRDIVIKKNNIVIGVKSKIVWLDITHNLLFYLSWDNGRIYFFIDKLKFNNDNGIKIRDLSCHDQEKSVSFNYKGDWDRDNGIIQVDDIYEIIFQKDKDYNIVKNIIDEHYK